ncbi:MAG: D-2-hydroxyacid dehydrogenase [Lysobacterales bacterium]|nr:MAG: D-2-hydroxyacid dehydrogenase [Xanthomonadales bacterium]
MTKKTLLDFACLALASCLLCPTVWANPAEDEIAAATRAMIEELGLRESATPARELPGWRRPAKVVAWLDRPEWLPTLQAAAPGVEIVPAASVEEATRAVADAQALLGFCEQEIFAQGPDLHWVQVYWSGVEDCVAHPGMLQGDKVLTNGQAIASPALAEHAIALMMALVRGLDAYHVNQLAGAWRDDVGLFNADFMELEGRTALVVGLGGIGTQTAKRAHGLGMRVIATRGSRREGPDYVDYVGLADETLELARQADVVINTTPLTDDTRGLFDAAFFKAMKPTAYFISVGRGASTVTDDLVAALRAGELAGAGLDVTDPEPLPDGHPLWTTPRVLISPHTAGRSDRTRERLLLLVRENLRRYVAGEPLLSVVDIQRGY